MTNLYEEIQTRVQKWRDGRYQVKDYTVISEILEYSYLPDGKTRRMLRRAQLRALETYWYLRLVEGTPHIFDLYHRYFPNRLEKLDALGLNRGEIKDFVVSEDIEELWRKIKEDENFVNKYHLESVHETITLNYPSYIFALAMGAGKTMLIGAIIATEFAMAMEYHPKGDGPFIQNALVFARGKTIFESLRELANIDYSKILPPRMYKPFESTYKLIFTRDRIKDIPVIRSSRYNLIVTNTEKIRIQKRSYRHHTWSDLYANHMLEQYEAEANLRLRAIASLPNLGIFSDEAHHTYGQEMGKRLKRVRQTVDYLNDQTNLITVINTTGTPYYERQPLRDVVIWYGLSEGIEDGILKSLENNIYAYDFDEQHTADFVSEVVRDFFETYGDVELPNGAKAKLAIYFPQTKDLQELRPVVEQTLAEMGIHLDNILRNTSKSTQAEIDAFNRLDDPDSPHRVILLVNKGVEGWDCPSLFACALARKLRRSKNFVLQASTRCLRQVPGNDHKARVYLSMDNRGTLDRQLQETYGETVNDLNQTSQHTKTTKLYVRKMEIPPLSIIKTIKRVVSEPEQGSSGLDISDLEKPDLEGKTFLVKRVYTPKEQSSTDSVMQQVDEEEARTEIHGPDLYTAATYLAALYRIDALEIFKKLKNLYGENGTVSENHLPILSTQIEEQTKNYKIQEEQVEVAMALIRHEGFEREQGNDGSTIYTTEITYRKDKEDLLLSWTGTEEQNDGDFGFHYTPYNFDSSPEKDYFLKMLHAINVDPESVEDIYFTGGLTDPQKTEFFVEYKGTDGNWHRYSPDFLIRRKDGKTYIVEIKAERDREHPVDGMRGKKAMAIRKWEALNPDELNYEMIFTGSESVAFNQLEGSQDFISSD